MLEKTFSTMHASNVVLQQQYRERKFEKYSELITVLLIAEKNNELLMRNHNMRPTGSAAVPEANAVDKGFPEGNTYMNKPRRNYGRGRGGFRGRRGRSGYGRGYAPRKHKDYGSHHVYKENKGGEPSARS